MVMRNLHLREVESIEVGDGSTWGANIPAFPQFLLSLSIHEERLNTNGISCLFRSWMLEKFPESGYHPSGTRAT